MANNVYYCLRIHPVSLWKSTHTIWIKILVLNKSTNFVDEYVHKWYGYSVYRPFDNDTLQREMEAYLSYSSINELDCLCVGLTLPPRHILSALKAFWMSIVMALSTLPDDSFLCAFCKWSLSELLLSNYGAHFHHRFPLLPLHWNLPVQLLV